MNAFLKKIKLLQVGLLIIFTMFPATLAYSINLTNFAQSILKRITLTHYKAGGNDFGGLFILTQLKDLDSSVNVTMNGEEISNCKKQLR